MLSLWTWARDHVLMLPNTVTVLLSPLMTWKYLKYVTVSKSLPPQLSSARFCHDWDLLCTLLCTLWTGSRCTIVQNSRAFYFRLKIVLSTLLSTVHPHVTNTRSRQLNPENGDYSIVFTSIIHELWPCFLFLNLDSCITPLPLLTNELKMHRKIQVIFPGKCWVLWTVYESVCSDLWTSKHLNILFPR